MKVYEHLIPLNYLYSSFILFNIVLENLALEIEHNIFVGCMRDICSQGYMIMCHARRVTPPPPYVTPCTCGVFSP